MDWRLPAPLGIDARMLRPRGFGLAHANPVLVLVVLALVIAIVLLARNRR